MNWGVKLLQSSALPLGYGAVLLDLVIITKVELFVNSNFADCLFMSYQLYQKQ